MFFFSKIDLIFWIQSSVNPIMKELSHKIEVDPKKRRCHNATQCHEWVKHGPNVYIDVIAIL